MKGECGDFEGHGSREEKACDVTRRKMGRWGHVKGDARSIFYNVLSWFPAERARCGCDERFGMGHGYLMEKPRGALPSWPCPD
jgi:hypothetical protein